MADHTGDNFGNTISGDGSNDRIYGLGGNDILSGGGGDDQLFGGGDDDTLTGGAGNDTFVYDSRGFGRDTITDFNVNGDKIDLSFLKVADFDSLRPFTTQVGQDVVIAMGWGGNYETITLKNVTLSNLSDADFKFNTSTADLTVNGNTTWADFLFGGKGNDTISGFSGEDTLVGGVGNDTLIGGADDDSLWGRTGNDTFVYDSRGFGRDVINDFNTNGDKIDLSFLKVADFDSLKPFTTQVGQDVVIAMGWGGNYETITLKNVTLSNLSDADFRFNTSTANLIVEGNTTWSDVLFGGKGSDKIYGYSGDDTLVGGSGNDTLFGGTGADRFFGGAGIDTVSYFGTAAGVSVNLAGTGSGGEAQGDTFNGVENVDGSGFADTLIGNAADNKLQGFDGNDDLRGGDGADILVGGAGADKFDGGNGIDTVSYFSSSTGVRVNLQTGTAGDGEAQGDTLIRVENVSGSQGHDKLYGSTGANTLQGWNGNDLLQGGAGKDTLSGGAGADKFVFTAVGDSVVGANADRITDFTRAQGDKIDLSGIDANAGTAGNQAFTFIGTSLFTHHAGELRYAFNGTDTTIAGDIDGDGTSDFHITLTGKIALLATDFIL
ncbi:MAG: calcium-binding protein [Inquilinus limosus]|uniref:Calcium-binding protein n=1 Tax=Inquilinus limosus TaxID=171674 RepID=A0A952FNL6_9PROT|nr:calcium-binding protein [Inquilinus limosus]